MIGGGALGALLYLLVAGVVLPLLVGLVVAAARRRWRPAVLGTAVSAVVAAAWWGGVHWSPFERDERAMRSVADQVTGALHLAAGALRTDPTQCSWTADEREGRSGAAWAPVADPAALADRLRPVLERLGYDVVVAGDGTVVSGRRGDDSVRVTVGASTEVEVSVGCIDYTLP